jgi:hypothetical protein
MMSPTVGRPPLNIKVFKEVYNALQNRSRSWTYIYGAMGEVIYIHVEGIKKTNLKDFIEGSDYFKTEEALLQCFHGEFRKNGHDIDIQVEKCTEVGRNEIQTSSTPSSSESSLNLNNKREISDAFLESPVVSPMVKLVGEEAINHFIQEEKSGTNMNYYLFPKIYPHLQELGWKKVEDLKHGSLHLAPWAAKSVEDGGIILANGKCDISLRDIDDLQMLLNRDYFIDNKKIVSYIRKHGSRRIEGLPSPATGDRKRVSQPTNYFKDVAKQAKLVEQTRSSSRKPPQTLSHHGEIKDEEDHEEDDDDDDSNSVSGSISLVCAHLEQSGEEIVISTIDEYYAAIFNGEKVSYYLLTKLLPLLEDIGWKKAKDTKDNSAYYIAQWVSSLCVDGGVMLDNGKCDVSNKLGGRGKDAGAIVENRDYFSDSKVMIEYLTTHGCRRVEEALIGTSKEESRRRSTVATVVSSSGDSLTNVNSKTVATKGVIAENKGKKYPLVVAVSTKATSGSSSSSSNSAKFLTSNEKSSLVSFEPLHLPVQTEGDPGKIDDEFRTDQQALLHMVLYPKDKLPHLNLNNYGEVKNALVAAGGKWHWVYSELGMYIE